MTSPYPLHYTLRWPFYYTWPSMRNRSQLYAAPDRQVFAPSQPDDIRLLFCGDIMVQNGDRIPTLHSELCRLIQSADLFIGNCEAPLGNHELNPKAKYLFDFHMPREYLENVIGQTGLPANQWLLSIANNHTGDQGHDACLRTFDILNELGVKPLGRYSAHEVPVQCVQLKNITLGFSAWTHWMNCENFPLHDPGANRYEHIIASDVAHYKQKNALHYLFGMPHWEYEFQHFPHQQSRQQAKLLIEHHGFDFLVGVHTHTLQPLEQFDKGICAYNLGNFSGQGRAWSVKLIPLLEVTLRANPSMQQIVSYQLHYFYQHHHANSIDIIPLELAPLKKRQRLQKRIEGIFK